MDFWLEWVALITVFSIAVMSPGPDFVMAIRNSVLYSRKAGFFTALGFGLGVLVHVTYTIVGIATLIAQSVLLFNIVKIAGAAYLIYMGIKALRSQGFEMTMPQKGQASQNHMSAQQALTSGFLTNLLNPKATLFFLAMFSQFLGVGTPLSIQILYGATCFVMVVLWFSTVAFVLTTPKAKALFLRAAKWIDRACGALLIALGLRLAFSKGVTP